MYDPWFGKYQSSTPCSKPLSDPSYNSSTSTALTSTSLEMSLVATFTELAVDSSSASPSTLPLAAS